MKIYNHGSHGCGTVFVTPGADHPETSDWIRVEKDSEGHEVRSPIMFTVKFTGGVADVPENLGRYMIKRKLATSSPLIVREQAA